MWCAQAVAVPVVIYVACRTFEQVVATQRSKRETIFAKFSDPHM